MKELKKIVINSGNNEFEIESESYFLDDNLKAKSEIKDFVDYYFNMSKEDIYNLQEVITKLHSDHEMNFQKKTAGGSYGEIVSTPFHGFAPIPQKSINKLVKSTAPILKEMRRILQDLFSGREVDLSCYSKSAKQKIRTVISENIYLEKKIFHKNMKDYPFLSVIGFDAALYNTQDPEPTFFEMNAGTPCGIEDQFQLFNHFKDSFPNFYKLIEKKLVTDNTHDLLRKTIEDCAFSWTGIKDGISVIISPGPYNPAHPEIASLSYHSGMPLVEMSDLYIDQEGYLRLGCVDEADPVISGIYNRKEESFLLYSNKLNIPMRSPGIMQANEKLSKEKGYKLESPILYDYIYANDGSILDVNLDENGEPKIQMLFDQLDSTHGQLIEAVWNKKVYVSNLGGRILDDKRIFPLLHEVVGFGAHPPKTILINDLEEKIQDAVIKAPDLSGGSGVMIGKELGREERKEVIQSVIKNPDYYEIQEFSKLSVIASITKKENKYQFIPMPVDWRLMIMFDSSGKTSMGPHGCLVRTAPFGSIKTNTSAGGGYAIGLIYENKPQNSVEKYINQKLKYLPQNRFEVFKTLVNNLINVSAQTSSYDLENFAWSFRSSMDLMHISNITFIHNIRDLRDGKQDINEFKLNLKQFLNCVINKSDFIKIKEFCREIIAHSH